VSHIILNVNSRNVPYPFRRPHSTDYCIISDYSKSLLSVTIYFVFITVPAHIFCLCGLLKKT
jgi:hypothetical protein